VAMFQQLLSGTSSAVNTSHSWFSSMLTSLASLPAGGPSSPHSSSSCGSLPTNPSTSTATSSQSPADLESELTRRRAELMIFAVALVQRDEELTRREAALAKREHAVAIASTGTVV